MNDIIRFTNDIAQTWITVPEGHADELVEYIAKAAENLNGTAPDAKVFKAGQLPLEELPKDVQQKVRDILGRDIWGMNITGAQPVERPTNNYGHDEWKPFRFWLPAPGAVDHKTYVWLEDSLRKFLQSTVFRRYKMAVTYQYTASAAMTATVRVKDYMG